MTRYLGTENHHILLQRLSAALCQGKARLSARYTHLAVLLSTVPKAGEQIGPEHGQQKAVASALCSGTPQPAAKQRAHVPEQGRPSLYLRPACSGTRPSTRMRHTMRPPPPAQLSPPSVTSPSASFSSSWVVRQCPHPQGASTASPAVACTLRLLSLLRLLRLLSSSSTFCPATAIRPCVRLPFRSNPTGQSVILSRRVIAAMPPHASASTAALVARRPTDRP